KKKTYSLSAVVIMGCGRLDSVFKKSNPINLRMLISKNIKSTVCSFKNGIASIALEQLCSN
ncbi:hypothetical protein, partial [Falsiruegeria litorea]|uniref:hypothetical protein n=1 Tax=Falsiruegeria litorea TaxID=1280831 RepID=UPI001BFED397